MASWDMQELRTRLCLTFRLNHRADCKDSSCCTLLFAKLTEVVVNSSFKEAFLLCIFVHGACKCKVVYFSTFNFDSLGCY